MKRISVLLITLSLVFLLGACSDKNEETLVVGLECDYAPFNWTVPTNEGQIAVDIEGSSAYCDGYDVRVASELATSLGLELRVEKISWDGLIPALTSGRIDVIIAGMSPTDERKEVVNFTNEYFRSEQVLIVDATGNFTNATSLDDLMGAKIVAQLNTLQDVLIDQISGVNHATPLGTYSALVESVKSTVNDALVAELPVAQAIIAANSDLAMVRFSGEYGFTVDDSDVSVSIAVRKDDNDLLDNLNSALESISNEIRNKWMSEAVNRQPN